MDTIDKLLVLVFWAYAILIGAYAGIAPFLEIDMPGAVWVVLSMIPLVLIIPFLWIKVSMALDGEE